MYFGPVPVGDAEGALLAHSVTTGKIRLRKGAILERGDVERLLEAGIEQVTVARLGSSDVPEDQAAAEIGQAVTNVRANTRLSVSKAFTGRANILADEAGLFRLEPAGVHAINAIDPSITLATLADGTRVQQKQMVATVKIIPYAAPRAAVSRATKLAAAAQFRVDPFIPRPVSLILTRSGSMKESLISKGRDVVAARIAGVGLGLAGTEVVEHEVAAVAGAIRRAEGEMILILGAKATSDVSDVCPAGLIEAGGNLTRFGMPVDPGNLLFLGDCFGRSVVGLPGCARSPALNGADWVLERLAVGARVTGSDIAAMGVGGLLKEIPQRPQPRSGKRNTATRKQKVAALVLAGGQSSRMRGRDKLLEEVDGVPLLLRLALEAQNSGASEVLVVLPPDRPERRRVLSGEGVAFIEAPEALEGMAGSIRAGLVELRDRADAVLIVLADMPEVGSSDLDRLIAAFDPAHHREICRATTSDGVPGHPVLFGRRFFEALGDLRQDRGAKAVLLDGLEFLVDVPLPGQRAVTDLDTPEDWDAWRASAS